MAKATIASYDLSEFTICKRPPVAMDGVAMNDNRNKASSAAPSGQVRRVLGGSPSPRPLAPSAPGPPVLEPTAPKRVTAPWATRTWPKGPFQRARAGMQTAPAVCSAGIVSPTTESKARTIWASRAGYWGLLGALQFRRSANFGFSEKSPNVLLPASVTKPDFILPRH